MTKMQQKSRGHLNQKKQKRGISILFATRAWKFLSWEGGFHLQNVTVLSRQFVQFVTITSNTPTSIFAGKHGED